MKYIRRGDIKSVYSLFGGRAEVIEFSICDNHRLNGRKLKDITLPDDSIILTVIRNGVNEIPDGSFAILPGDTVITISKLESVSAIEQLFTAE